MKLLPQLITTVLLCPLLLFAQADSLDLSGSLSKIEKKEKKITLFELFSQDPSTTVVTRTSSTSTGVIRDWAIVASTRVPTPSEDQKQNITWRAVAFKLIVLTWGI